jgi:hypothetical protein
MKRQFFILSLSALTLFSCGGSQNTKTNENAKPAENLTADKPSKNEEVTENKEVKEEINVPETFMNFVKKLSDNPDKPVYYLADVDNNENYVYCGNYYYAYPQKNGGYTTIYKRIDSAEYGSMTNWSKAFSFQNKELHNAENALPVPDVSLLIDESKTAGHEADVNSLKELYNKYTSKFLHYIFSDTEPIVRVEIQPLYDDKEWKDSFSDIIRYDNWSSYKWDGEKFVPYDALTEFVKTLPANPDKPFYHKLDSYQIVESYCENNNNYYAFPLKDGGYMALADYNSQCEASMSWKNETYTYKASKLTKVDNVLPLPKAEELLSAEKCQENPSKAEEITKQYNSRPKGFLIYSVDEFGSLSVSMEGNGCEQWGEDDLEFMQSAIYKWNGDSFEKQ